MTNDNSAPGLTTRVVWYDDDMIELASTVVFGHWSASATAYASPLAIREDAEALSHWTHAPQGVHLLEAGGDTGIGFLRLRFYTIDLAGHMRCQVQLSTRAGTQARPEEIWRLAVELPVEPGLVDQFAANLRRIAQDRKGEAVLQAIPNP